MISINPTTGKTIAEYAETPPDQVAHHIASAHALQREWAHTDLSERSARILELADILETHRDDLAVVMAEEMGEPVQQGRAEVDKCAWVCR